MQPENTVQIPVYRFGRLFGYALIDQCDFAELSPWLWRVLKTPKTWYVCRYQRDGKTLLMHDVLMQPPEGYEVDHINRQGFDNRRQNLRVVTRAQNAQNKSGNRTATSPARGVYWEKSRQRWRAVVNHNGKRIFCEHFSTEEEATAAVTVARKRLFPFSSD